MKNPITRWILTLACLVTVAISCTKDAPTPVIKTLTIFASKDATIFNGTNTFNASGVNGQYNDHGSGGGELIRVGYTDNEYYLMRALLAFDVSTIPAGAKIVSATIQLTKGKSGDKSPAVSVYKLTQDWTEGTSTEANVNNCTWNNSYCTTPGAVISTGDDVSWTHSKYSATPWTTEGGTFVATASCTVSTSGITTFSSQGLIDDVKSWITTPASNFGWLLKVDEAALTGDGGEQIRYFGKEAADNGAPADTKPRLVIVYQQ